MILFQMRIKGLVYTTQTSLAMLTCVNCGCHILLLRNEVQNCNLQTQNAGLMKDMVVGFVLFCFSLSLTALIITGGILVSDSHIS